MTVKEFCCKYNVTHQTVYKKIKRKRQELEQHIVKKDGHISLDDYAENLLKPFRPEVEFKENIQLLQKKLLIKDRDIENLNEEVSCQKKEILQLKHKLENAENENFRLRELVNDFEKRQTVTNDAHLDKKKNIFEKFGEIIGKN